MTSFATELVTLTVTDVLLTAFYIWPATPTSVTDTVTDTFLNSSRVFIVVVTRGRPIWGLIALHAVFRVRPFFLILPATLQTADVTVSLRVCCSSG